MRALAPLSSALAFLLIAATADSLATTTEAEENAAAAAWVMAALPCLLFGLLLVRPLFARKARLAIHPDRLELTYPPLIKSPLVIPRSYVKAVAVDPRPVRLGWFREHRRFHLGLGHGGGGGGEMDEGLAVEPDTPEWLWSRRGSPLPELSHAMDVPNVAILFHRRLPPLEIRRMVRPFPSVTPVHSPRRGQPLRGLLFRVKDPKAAERALTEWGVVRPITIDDVLTLKPDISERKRARRRRIKTAIGLGVIVLLQSIPPFFVE